MESAEIAKLRQKIDAMDRRILKLLNLRAKYVIDIAKIKHSLNLPVLDRQRESMIIKSLTEENKGPLKSEDVISIFKSIISVLRDLESRYMNENYLKNPEQ
ncbi:MAG: chorismate mutase [Fidelibacterota bacterium]